MAKASRCTDSKGRFTNCSRKRAGRSGGEWGKSKDFLEVAALANEAALGYGELAGSRLGSVSVEVTGDEYGRYHMRSKPTNIVLTQASRTGAWTVELGGTRYAIEPKLAKVFARNMFASTMVVKAIAEQAASDGELR
jgi:hypothetical protein